MKYVDTVQIRDHTTVGSVNRAIEAIQGVGKATLKQRGEMPDAIEMEVEAEDGWELRDVLDELKQTLWSEDLDWTPDRSHIVA